LCWAALFVALPAKSDVAAFACRIPAK
jgi:hypothetical protein